MFIGFNSITIFIKFCPRTVFHHTAMSYITIFIDSFKKFIFEIVPVVDRFFSVFSNFSRHSAIWCSKFNCSSIIIGYFIIDVTVSCQFFLSINVAFIIFPDCSWFVPLIRLFAIRISCFNCSIWCKFSFGFYNIRVSLISFWFYFFSVFEKNVYIIAVSICISEWMFAFIFWFFSCYYLTVFVFNFSDKRCFVAVFVILDIQIVLIGWNFSWGQAAFWIKSAYFKNFAVRIFDSFNSFVIVFAAQVSDFNSVTVRIGFCCSTFYTFFYEFIV